MWAKYLHFYNFYKYTIQDDYQSIIKNDSSFQNNVSPPSTTHLNFLINIQGDCIIQLDLSSLLSVKDNAAQLLFLQFYQ